MKRQTTFNYRRLVNCSRTVGLSCAALLLLAGLLMIPSASPARAQTETPGPGLTQSASFSGRGGYSADGLGETSAGGAVQADVPAGSTVQTAFLYGSYFSSLDQDQLTIDFDGTDVLLSVIATTGGSLTTARADVTTQVAAKVGSGGGITDFVIGNDPSALDGVALVVLFSNPSMPSTAISVVDGAANTTGDSATVNFPPLPSGFSAIMSLGIGFSSQDGLSDGTPGTHECGPGGGSFNQYSEVDVSIEGGRLTSCAGNYDDGTAGNGGLITVGGVGDSTDNPSDAFQTPGDGNPDRVQEDELYDLAPFLNAGDDQVTITTNNPSNDDNLFLAVVETSTAADLSITKSDSAPYGPDPVSSNQPVAYGITVTNNGPDPATGVTVTDTPLTAGATVQSGFGTSWTCDPIVSNTLTCHYSPTLNAGDTASPLTAVVKAPTNSGTSDTSMTDQANVTGGQFDPNNENDTATQSTTVKGSNSGFSKDQAKGFFDGVNTLTIATTRDTQGRFYSSLTIPGNSGLGAGVVSIDETQAYPTLCGGKTCDAQVQLSVVPAGTTPSNNAIQVHLFYVKDTKQGSTIYVQGDNELFGTALQNCIVRGIANPPKCVNSRSILKNGDRDIMLLWTNGGDPWTGKK